MNKDKKSIVIALALLTFTLAAQASSIQQSVTDNDPQMGCMTSPVSQTPEPMRVIPLPFDPFNNPDQFVDPKWLPDTRRPLPWPHFPKPWVIYSGSLLSCVPDITISNLPPVGPIQIVPSIQIPSGGGFPSPTGGSINITFTF